ncbi:helix-turn-helix transcriptional regulator [Lysobacter arvi]|uniref:AAA family ATPase n=1 Tax=Lysobacter arvi TaxID=3038776 RepID=A0ABU1C9X6_9GAMM|nr:AAA family ATPase [Lysobacter arvi]MDR0181993.1 AAA family ATPase [Lysobacter arvi]
MSGAARRSSQFLNRIEERGALSHLVERVRASQSQVLVLRGEAGSGKTSLLRQLSEEATGARVIWATGVESEMELAFAGLHALCVPFLDRMGRLPQPQHEALRKAFGLSAGPPPERFLVGLAVLGLLAEAAEDQPIVCVVDDAHWLDQMSSETLKFVARRLLAERVGLIFSVREQGGETVLAGLPDLVLKGLDLEHATLLLENALSGPLDEQVKARILDETRGNPLALIELPRGMTPAELAGGFAFPAPRNLTKRIERSFIRRFERLPRDSRLLLLLAAAEPIGDVALLWRAADRLGIGTDAAAMAESAGLLDLGMRVRFPHPLVRSAVYAASELDDRRKAHRALAEVTDPALDPDRRAWHRANATSRPEEEVAAEMVQSAGRAQARGGLAAAAAFLERASELTPDPTVRVTRALDAAEAKLEAGDFASASRLLASAGLGSLGVFERGRLERLRAQLVFATRRGADSSALLCDAARRLEPLDAAIARETYVEAISAAMFAGGLGPGPHEREIAQRAGAMTMTSPTSVADMLLNGLVVRFTEGYSASISPLIAALQTLKEVCDHEKHQRWLWIGCRLAQELWDDHLWHALAQRGVQIGRATGRISLLANATNHLAAFHVHAGDLSTAQALIDEVDLIEQATGLPSLKYSAALLAATRGEQREMQIMWDTLLQNAAMRGEGQALTTFWCVSARLHNGCGEYDKALHNARRACEREDTAISYGWALAEYIEAAIRVGSERDAASALDCLIERTRSCGTEWSLGVEARCRGLLSGDEGAYRSSIEHLARSRAGVDLARSQLCYGEWLRRENRRSDAREPLRHAYESFKRMGASAFAERSRRELLATGEMVRKRVLTRKEALTPQEMHVALMARDGHTNSEIGARFYISPRTVEYHLHKVFQKLEIPGRRDLREALAKEGYASGVD